MPSTNRRRVLAVGVAPLLSTLAGCEEIRRRGVKFTLSMDSVVDGAGTDESVLDFDDEDLRPDECEVIESAIEDGEFTEGYVGWNDAPNRTPISEGFKSVILRFTDHEQSTEEKERGTPNLSSMRVETFARYDGGLYEARVTSQSAE